jgi:hypothetical protein
MITSVKLFRWLFTAALLVAVSGGAADRQPRVDDTFFNGKDLKGWATSQPKYWSVKDGAIVGHSAVNVPKNEFIWSTVPVQDFYLSVDVKLTPDNRNAGIQFRSRKADAAGQAHGYQADMGAGVWGKLYHEHGRGKLDWNNRAAKAVKRGEWNRYEILAIGHQIWTAINGTLCVAIDDPKGELSGQIAFQIHSGPAQTAAYRVNKLIHNPKLALDKQTEKQLLAALPKKTAATPASQTKSGWTPQVIAWRAKVDANDPGMTGQWFAPAHDAAKWKVMNLPRHYETAGLPGHDGTAWFRRAIELPVARAGKPLTLALGPIDDMDMTWFNGTQIGGIETPGFWAKPRVYAVPGKLVKAGRNVITVRVIDHGLSGGFAGNAAQMRITATGQKPILISGNWKYKTGVTLKSLGLGQLTNPSPPKPKPKAASAPPSAHALVRPLAKPAKPVPAFANGFALKGDQSLVIIGNANAADCQYHGQLEMLLASAHPGQRLRLRNMAWPADTIYTQQRPRNFFATYKPGYGEKDRRPHIAADVIFVWFGQIESLEGTARLNDFTKAYGELLTELSTYTGRLVLVTPVPAGDPLGLGLDVKQRNTTMARYAAAIRKLARNRNLPVVDLFNALKGKHATTDGLALSPFGHQLAAATFAAQLNLPAPRNLWSGPLRKSILKKNALWRQYWLPTNWAFLYGNRQQTASSRSHLNSGYRWFPEEIQSILPELEKLENAITQEAARARQ